MAFKTLTEIIHNTNHELLTYNDIKKYIKLFSEKDQKILRTYMYYRVLYNSITWEYTDENVHFDYEIGGLTDSSNKWIFYCDDVSTQHDVYYSDIDMYYWEIVLLHEMAHAAVGAKEGHNQIWKDKCSEIAKNKFPDNNDKYNKLFNIFMYQIGKSTK